MKYGDECYCMYCKETYIFSVKETYKRCCRQCSLVRDYCLAPDCNEYSMLRSGYQPNMDSVAPEDRITVRQTQKIMKQKGMPVGSFTYGPVNILMSEWIDENKDIFKEDVHYMHNHCRECFHKLIGWDGK